MATIREYAKVFGWLYYHPYDSRRSTPGFPDCTFVREGRLIFAELKLDVKTVTENQHEWLSELGNTAAEVYLWTPDDLDNIEEILR